MFSSQLHLGLPSGLFPSVLPTQLCTHLSCLPYVPHAQAICSLLALVLSFEKQDDCEWRNGKEEVVLLTAYFTTLFPKETEKSHDIFYLKREMRDYVSSYSFLTLKYKEFVTHLKMVKVYGSIFRPYFKSSFRAAVRLRFITVLAEIRFLVAKLRATQAQRHFLAPP